MAIDPTTSSPSRRRLLWALGGVVFLGVAAVSVWDRAWAGAVSAVLLAAVLFTIAARLPGAPSEEPPSDPRT